MHYIYKITNIVTNKIYVGRSNSLTRSGKSLEHYFGSGLAIKRSVRKYGKENHKKEVLEWCTPETVFEREQYWIEKLDAMNPAVGYNLVLDSCGFTSETGRATAEKFYSSLTPEQKKTLYAFRAEKMREQAAVIAERSRQMWARRTKEETAEIRKKLSDSWTPEMRKAQSARMKGSKRKSNKEYLILKYGEVEGLRILQEQQEAARRNSRTDEAREKRVCGYKQTYRSCPIYEKIAREVSQPKAAISRRLKNGSIDYKEATELLEKIEIRRKELQEELTQWKDIHANNKEVI